MPASPSICQLSQELIFKLTTIFSTLQNVLRLFSNVSTFGSKRKGVLFQTPLRFIVNA